MVQSVNVLVLPKSTNRLLATTRQLVPSGPPATRRSGLWPGGGLTQAKPPFTDAAPDGQLTSSLMFRLSPPSGGVSVMVRSTTWRPVPPGGFAAATVLAAATRIATTATTIQDLRMRAPSTGCARSPNTENRQAGQAVTSDRRRGPRLLVGSSIRHRSTGRGRRPAPR